MRICLIQTDPVATRNNIHALDWAINHVNADLYVTPELFTIGFDYLAQNCRIPDQKWWSDAEVIPNGMMCQKIMGLLHNRSSVVVCGLLERFGDDFYNIAAVISNGAVERYRQKHPATTAQTGKMLPIKAGADYQKITVCLAGPSLWSMGLMVCNDHFQDEQFFAEYKKRRADAVVLIADSSTRSWISRFPPLCQQYGLPAIICNAAGLNGGQSCVINAAGEFLPLRVGDKQHEYLGEGAIAALATI